MKTLMTFRINFKLDNWNKIIGRCRANRFYANKHKQQEMKLIRDSLIDLPKIDKYPVQIVFKWHVKASTSDLDNKSVKNILDEMQIMGILENDNIKHINKITHYAIKDKADYVDVEIIEGDNDVI